MWFYNYFYCLFNLDWNYFNRVVSCEIDIDDIILLVMFEELKIVGFVFVDNVIYFIS